MKNGQIILGIVSGTVAVPSGLAFKSHHFTRNPVFGKTALSSSNCMQCNTFRTGTEFATCNCKTVMGVKQLLATMVGCTCKL
jgi:hypothetical protein